MKVDEGFQFRKIFADLESIHDVKIEKSGVEYHNIPSIHESYHKPLRDIYRKLKIDDPTMQRQLLLALEIKAMSENLGPEGFFPLALVFGVFPSFRSILGPVLPRTLA